MLLTTPGKTEGSTGARGELCKVSPDDLAASTRCDSLLESERDPTWADLEWAQACRAELIALTNGTDGPFQQSKSLNSLQRTDPKAADKFRRQYAKVVVKSLVLAMWKAGLGPAVQSLGGESMGARRTVVPLLQRSMNIVAQYPSEFHADIYVDTYIHELFNNLGAQRTFREICDEVLSAAPAQPHIDQTVPSAPATVNVPPAPRETPILSHGDGTYSMDGVHKVKVTSDENSMLQAFIDHPEPMKTNTLLTIAALPRRKNLSQIANNLSTKYDGLFGPAIIMPGNNSLDGYFIRVVKAPA